MQALVAPYPGSELSLEAQPKADEAAELAREFEERLADSSTLAFRVAMGVLHNRQDAEDVAQEAFLRAYRNFHRLRE